MAPALVSTGLYGRGKAVRSSTILKLVGAGGIGFEPKVASDLFDYRTALAVIGLIAVVVVGMERASDALRLRILGRER